jgi:hypothetical protein
MVARTDKPARNFSPGRFVHLLFPRLEDVLFLGIFLSVIGLGSRLLNMDGDLGRHLTIGNFIIDSFSIPTRDVFSHTMVGFPLTPHEWLAQVSFSVVYRIAGLNGVVVLSAIMIALTFTLVYRQCFKRSQILLMSLVITVLAAAAASVHWLARPHIFTLLFTVLWIGELENLRKNGRVRLWLLPLIMVIWVNFHGAFIAGFVIWGIYLLSSLVEFINKHPDKSGERSVMIGSTGLREPWVLLITGFLALCGTLINPVGWRIWETTISFLRNSYLVGHTMEYLPPDFHQVNFWPFLLMICVSIIFLSFNRKKISIVSALLITLWTAMGLISARNISIYAVVAAPILAGIIAGVLVGKHKLRHLANFDARLRFVDDKLFGHIWPALMAILILVLLMSGFVLDFNRDGNNFLSHKFPVTAVDWILEQDKKGPMFNYFPWGGYLLYRMWPEEQVFIDGQTDFYGEALTRQYEKVLTLQDGWQEILTQYQVRWVLMPTDSRLIEALSEDPRWELTYQDKTATIYALSN